MTLAHVVAPPGNHLVFLWPASAAAAAGVVLALINRRQIWRRLWAGVGGAGLAATVLVYVLEPSYAARPPFAIRLVAATAPGDIAVMVCPDASSVGQFALPGSRRLLDVYVDGRVVAEGASPRFLLRVSPGKHMVHAELVQANHVAFLPAETTPIISVTAEPGLGLALPSLSC